jgi:glycosyltransferase involved in cell wall biosynthesis
MPYLLAACDIYAAPSRLEDFGMIQIEANACEKPVIGIKAMGMLDTLVHGKTAFLADVAQETRLQEAMLADKPGRQKGRKRASKRPRIVDYRASVNDSAGYLMDLMQDPGLRERMGKEGRKRVVENFDYRVIAKRFVEIVSRRLGVS